MPTIPIIFVNKRKAVFKGRQMSEKSRIRCVLQGHDFQPLDVEKPAYTCLLCGKVKWMDRTTPAHFAHVSDSLAVIPIPKEIMQ